MQYDLKSPCRECPFRAKSLPGYLGPDSHDPETFTAGLLGRHLTTNGYISLGDCQDHACHMSTNAAIESEGAEDYELDPDTIQHCAGALLFLKSSCKRPWKQEKIAAIDRAKAKEPMLKNLPEFIAHHGPRK